MDIIKNLQDKKLTVALKGRLDTNTAPELEQQLNEVIETIEELEFDFTELEYISSAGLRVLLAAQKAMNKQGSMKVTHVKEEIMEVFSMTGFLDIITVE